MLNKSLCEKCQAAHYRERNPTEEEFKRLMGIFEKWWTEKQRCSCHLFMRIQSKGMKFDFATVKNVCMPLDSKCIPDSCPYILEHAIEEQSHAE